MHKNHVLLCQFNGLVQLLELSQMSIIKKYTEIKILKDLTLSSKKQELILSTHTGV